MNDSTISTATALDRRQFLKVTGGFLLALTFPVGTHRALADTNMPANATGTAYIRIGTDESITIMVGGGEMGQGIYTGLAMGAAEELKVAWSSVKVTPLDATFSWLSAGSGGIRSRLPTFLKAGAAAREMLISAAAQTWGVNRALCLAANGAVTYTDPATSIVSTLTYGQLAPTAATLPVPTAPPLTPATAYTIIGTPAARVDLPPKTNGSARYGLDAVVDADRSREGHRRRHLGDARKRRTARQHGFQIAGDESARPGHAIHRGDERECGYGISEPAKFFTS